MMGIMAIVLLVQYLGRLFSIEMALEASSLQESCLSFGLWMPE